MKSANPFKPGVFVQFVQYWKGMTSLCVYCFDLKLASICSFHNSYVYSVMRFHIHKITSVSFLMMSAIFVCRASGCVIDYKNSSHKSVAFGIAPMIIVSYNKRLYNGNKFLPKIKPYFLNSVAIPFEYRNCSTKIPKWNL